MKQTGVLVAAAASGTWVSAAGSPSQSSTVREQPWYRRVLRWGQTNITEADPERYDVGWWRRYWKRTETQGVIINAGGIVAYYPTQVPFHRQAERLNGRDLFGELCRAAHQDGLAVFARMDSNRAHEDLYQAHPDWFALNRDGKVHKAGELFVTCINGPYYEQHIPSILREIVERYRPEGFTDNSWSALGRSQPCFCENCRNSFRARTGQEIPQEANWDDDTYRKWIEWNYARRLEIWDLNNRVTQAAGGPQCLWVGMNSGSVSAQAASFRDLREICRRSEMIMLDHQARDDATGFQQNGETGKLIHGVLGWDKLAPESMALYQAGNPTFRLAAKPAPEAHLWMLEGIAGGLQPWWHHVGAYHEDRRMYHTAEPIYRWHKANQRFLVHRRPIATVGVVWSQRNTDFYGRNDASLLVDQPWRGIGQALIRARIPFMPVHADDLERDRDQFEALILPNLAAVSDAQIASLRDFVQRGGALLATGESTLFNEHGERRPDFGLAELFRAHWHESVSRDTNDAKRVRDAGANLHSYLRLSPELRARVDGPHIPSEPEAKGRRHEVLAGFDETDILAFGGTLEPLHVEPGALVPFTFVPPFPIYPPETAWMRQPRTDIPGLILSTTEEGARIAFLPADLDRRFARYNLPDHGDLLANLVRWILRDKLPLTVQGRGLLDLHLYRQDDRLILHLLNLTNPATWRQPVHEIIPIGPLRIRLKLPPGVRGKSARLLVANRKLPLSSTRGWAHMTIDSVAEHEMLVLD